MYRIAAVATCLLTGLGCESPSVAESAAFAASAPAGSSTAVSSSGAPSRPRFPPEARRDSSPKAIAETALAVGAAAPPLAGLPSTRGQAWSRGDGVTVLVFYRGHW